MASESLPSFSKTMESDAQVSEAGLNRSDQAKQPSFVWYKRTVSSSRNGGSSGSLPNEASEEAAKPATISSRQSASGGPPLPPARNLQASSDDGHSEGVDYDCYTEPSVAAATSEYSIVMADSPGDSRPQIPEGNRTVIAILDSGINAHHMAFGDRKIHPKSRSFVSEDDMDFSDHLGHGTQCAGLACGNETRIQVPNSSEPVLCSGIALGARVLVCKVVPYGSSVADIDAVCRALQYIIDHNQQNPALGERVNVISLSFGISFFSRRLSKMIELAVDGDIIVICAASNDGKRSKQPITYPARLGHVICIGSDNGYGKPSSFSPVGREMDFLAPGENLWAPTIDNSNPSGSYSTVSGTSFAAPAVAGLVCQLIEDLQYCCERFQKPELLDHLHNVWGIRELLKHMATVQGSHNEEKGFGTLEPSEYFNKIPQEKMRIINSILGI